MTERVHRVTMFKLPNKEHQEILLGHYKNVRAESKKDGKPYIIDMAVGVCEPDERSQGFDFAARFIFASLEDMKYYDWEDPVHQALKAAGRDLDVKGLQTIYFKEKLVGGIQNE